MGLLADRLDNMHVTAVAPGGAISGELRGRDCVRVTFAAGRYQWLDERYVEQQLAALGRLLWAGRMKAYWAAVSEALGTPVSGEDPPVGPRDVDYQSARGGIVAEGRSDDGSVQIEVRGMRDWTVRIVPGSLRRFREDEFSVRVQQAATALIRDQFAQVRSLKDSIYGTAG
ncbi:hypothetical protein O7621_10445 [Solwaraspora sp. WMMD937]|uniref:hypothetical protein n=1 Tax=Solwaraspora sp. WMMD937 TaxID=3016090 RepID=UPI00249BAB01|nr:hypothetical protein [Solwaraspora sp. WMMD937]WFE23647.1 hypothetical protein O7621_10445 [Solwaraspora sp. WMMD937]